MKNDMKLKGWLQRFLGWPLYMGILVLAMTAASALLLLISLVSSLTAVVP